MDTPTPHIGPYHLIIGVDPATQQLVYQMVNPDVPDYPAKGIPLINYAALGDIEARLRIGASVLTLLESLQAHVFDAHPALRTPKVK